MVVGDIFFSLDFHRFDFTGLIFDREVSESVGHGPCGNTDIGANTDIEFLTHYSNQQPELNQNRCMLVTDQVTVAFSMQNNLAEVRSAFLNFIPALHLEY